MRKLIDYINFFLTNQWDSTSQFASNFRLDISLKQYSDSLSLQIHYQSISVYSFIQLIPNLLVENDCQIDISIKDMVLL